MYSHLKIYLLIIAISFCFQDVYAQFVVGNQKGVSRYQHRDGKNSLEIQHKGEIKISDDDRSILDISNDGFLHITKTSFGNKRAIEVRKRSGRLEYEYRVGNRSESEREGKAWLSDILLDVIRRSSIGAEDRVARFMQRGGVSALLREIDEIESSSGKQRYFDILLSNYNLRERELTDVTRNLSSISSSSARGSLFRKHYGHFMQSDNLAELFFDAIAQIPSSSERGSILRTMLKNERLSDAKKVACLKAVASIPSNSERGSVLRMMINNDLLSDREVAEAFFRTLNGIESSSERGSVLRLLLDEKNWDQATSVLFFDAVSKIPSSSEKGSLLRKGSFLVQYPPAIKPYFDAIRNISSSSEKGSALRHLLGTNQVKLNRFAYLEIFKAVQSMSSSSEKGSVLRTAARYMDTSDAGLVRAFEDAAASISSSSEYRSVMSSLKKGRVEEY